MGLLNLLDPTRGRSATFRLKTFGARLS